MDTTADTLSPDLADAYQAGRNEGYIRNAYGLGMGYAEKRSYIGWRKGHRSVATAFAAGIADEIKAAGRTL